MRENSTQLTCIFLAEFYKIINKTPVKTIYFFLQTSLPITDKTVECQLLL